MIRRILPALFLFIPTSAFAQDVNEETKKAMKAAALKAAPAIARIETSGGSEAVWGANKDVMFRRGTGATTGLVVDPAGYVITSTFNFIGKPSDIFVTVPGKPRAVAKIVGSDPTRMLTLLKFDQTGLPMPTAFPKADIEVGMWSVALGRTLTPSLDAPPSINGGIVSAVNRIWGKAVQSDAKISPVNYGGPLVAIDGRVMGVIVPISPNSDGETAGFEWYDVGIGFAVPLEDVMRIVPKLKAGTAEKPVVLRAGMIGITLKDGDDYSPGCTVDTVALDSPADKAGMKAGDVFLEIDGKQVNTRAQFFHQLRPKYEGDTIAVKTKRGEAVREIAALTLAGSQTSFEPGFLGVLLMRDDPEPGVEVRFVYPNTAADRAGIKVGDRIMKAGQRITGPVPKGPPGQPAPGPQPFSGRDQFMAILQNFASGTAISVEVKRKDGKTEKLDIVLGKFTDDVPAELPPESTAKQALTAPKPVGPQPPKKGEPKKVEPKKEDKEKEKEEVKTGLQKITGTGAQARNFWVFVPDNYDKNIAHGLIVWLHPAGRDGRDADDMVKIWEIFCERHHFLMVGPTAGAPAGWVAGEAEGVMADVRYVRTHYTVDPKRIVAHGSGVGGQMAYYLAINQREVIRGAVPIGALLANNPKEPVPNQRVAFLVIAGAKDPLVKDIIKGQQTLVEKKYHAIYREMKESGKEYVNDDFDVFKEMVRWMDTLDRQ